MGISTLVATNKYIFNNSIININFIFSMAEIKRCNCTHEAQDKLYGKNNRLMNEFGNPKKGYRCTVCGKEYTDNKK